MEPMMNYTVHSTPIEKRENTSTNRESEGAEQDNINNINSPFVRDMNLVTPQQYLLLDKTVMEGKFFSSLVEAQNFFTKYSKILGFGLRKDEKRFSARGFVTIRRWVCFKEGFRRSKEKNEKEVRCDDDLTEIKVDPKTKREARQVTRTGCKAAFRILLDRRRQVWEITGFDSEHNHDLCISIHVPYLRANRIVPQAIFNMAQGMKEVGIKTSQLMDYVVEQSSGFENAGFIARDLQNRMDNERNMQMKDGDAVTALAYLYAHAERDPGFFLKFSVDKDKRLHNMFWRDSVMRSDYYTFGEVLGFDATYKKNVYKKPLVVFIGVNHHFKSSVFGFGLLANETEETYIWLLQTFLESMGDKAPQSVITDSDPAMMQAVKQVLVGATHRLCSWHIGKNANENIQGEEETRGFLKCMKKVQTREQFDHHWEEYKTNFSFNPAGLRFITKMDGRRDMWAEAYLRGKFFAKMRANQRCESMNSYLKHFLQCRLRMFEFVRQIDRAVRRIRHVETFDDCNDSIGAPSVTTHLKKLEGHAAQVFTRRVFFMVREELKREINYIMRSAPEIHSDHYVYTLTKYQSEKSYSVKFWVANGHITCSCLGFETDGIPCRHAFAVMKHENLTEIPLSLILDRWKKNAKANVECRRANSNNDEEGQTARYGSLYAAASRMLYLGAKYVKCYPTVLDQISKVTAMLEEIAIAEETTGTTEAPINPTIAEVFNPVVVRTKGCGTQRKERISGTRRCKYCEEVGHNSRSCPTKKRDELNQTTSQRARAETPMESQQYGQNFYPNGGTTPIGSETQSWSQYMPFESTVFNDGLGKNRVGPSLGFPFDDDY